MLQYDPIIYTRYELELQVIRASIPLGIFGVSEESVKPYIENGYTLITVGIDTMLTGEDAGKIIHHVQP